jgi:hypothetical protein
VRRACRKDEYHQACGLFFRNLGWSGLDLSMVGDGCPDWLFAQGLFAFMVEVKTPKARNSETDKDGMRDSQLEFHAKWGGRIYVAKSVDDFWKIYRAVEASKREV